MKSRELKTETRSGVSDAIKRQAREAIKRVTIWAYRKREKDQAEAGLKLNDQCRLVCGLLADQEDEIRGSVERLKLDGATPDVIRAEEMKVGMTMKEIIEQYQNASPEFTARKLAASESTVQNCSK